MDKIKRRKDGVISIEATIALSAFLFFMMFLYSVLFIVIAQRYVNTAVVRAADSLALETYSLRKLENENKPAGALAELFGFVGTESTSFSTETKWYESNAEAAIEARFNGFLGGGDNVAVQEALDKLGVSNVSFAGSAVDGNDNLVVCLSYEITPTFNFFDLLSSKVEKKVTVQLWGK